MYAYKYFFDALCEQMFGSIIVYAALAKDSIQCLDIHGLRNIDVFIKALQVIYNKNTCAIIWK